ncbi:LytTR family transcriptional regulator DNA-binding domain-containing protein [Paenibacillus sabinae]|uniref:HTH LytTR-type domain-containing protein n=1 Tax=Paenibacillus sabinae T27 TaxID=1268072 RepID=X4ZL62_9BACL|nr:LytTR family transcriptional regulator DNA-binding domain-containing protein [Paenibacillus sabinae]AHV98027.1 hypothetical protein PSAB_15600 [Paenibacillus sabinae T27]
MALLSVTKDVGGKSGITNIEIGDILMLSYSKSIDRVLVHTAETIYYTIGTLTFWNEVLNNSGHNFSLVDRSNSLNLDKVVILDPTFKVAYFESNITPKSKRCIIAGYRFNEVKKSLNLINPGISIQEGY